MLQDSGEGDEPDALEEFADTYAEKLQAVDTLVESVEYRFQPDPRFLDLFAENALLFVPPSEIPRIADRLTDEAIGRQVRDNRLMLMSPAGSLSEGLVLKDPLGLMPLLVGRLLSHRGALKIDLSSGYYLSTDGRSIIMLVKPKRPSMNLAHSRQLLDAARKAEADTREELSSGEPSRIGTRVRYSGNPATLVEEAQLPGGTVVTTGLASFVAALSVLDNLFLGVKGGKIGDPNNPNTWTVERIFRHFPMLQKRAQQQGRLLSGGEQQMLTIGGL